MAARRQTNLHIAGFLLLASGLSGVAQQPASSPQAAPGSSGVTLKVQTQLTVEDVTVTDGKGKPVHGLTESDFTVKEDGKPQTIKNFQEYGTERLQAAPPQLPPHVYTNQQATTTSAFNILLFDDVATGASLARSPENLMLSRLEVIKYLKAMPSGTQVAILELTTGLHIVQGFTSDRELLLAAVDSIKPESVPGTYLPPGRSVVTEACMAMNTQSQITTDALEAIVAFVAGIKGRKNLIWFTPGIPWLTDESWSDHSCIADYTPHLNKAYSLLSAARVAIDPVDPVGLTPASRLADKVSIQAIAKDTGGQAYFNRNDLDAAVGEAIATVADYYSLSYVPPPSKYDGKYHSIDVKVDRPGLHLQYREGYTALDAAKLLKSDKESPEKTPAPPDSEFNAAMGHGLPNATELLFAVQVQPSTQTSKPGGPSGSTVIGSLSPSLKGKPLVRYDLLYELPAGEITLAGDDPSGARKGSFKIAVMAYSDDGELLNSTGKTAAFTIKRDQVAQFMQQPSSLHVQLDLPLGKVFVRVGVLDVSSQKMGTLEIPETVDTPEAAARKIEDTAHIVPTPNRKGTPPGFSH